MLNTIHLFLGYGAVVAVLVGVAWSVVLVLGGGAGGRGFERFQAAVVSLLIVNSASGLTLLLLGGRPSDGLHFLYAAVGVGLIPLARSYLSPTGERRGGWLLLAAFVILGGVVYRLFTTG